MITSSTATSIARWPSRRARWTRTWASTARITPVKQAKGKQPDDAGSNVIAVPHLFGPGGYWQTYEWNSAIAGGMKKAGLAYSGKYAFAETDMYWKVNHMGVPKAQALGCNDCHGANGRMDWKALGYAGDPRRTK